MRVEAFLLPTDMTEQTWSNFSSSDIGLALIGLAGLVSVVVVLRTAFGNVTKRELRVKQLKKLTDDATE